MPPKSDKLKREEEASQTRDVSGAIALADPPVVQEGPVKVRIVDCCNDFVAILQTQILSTIELSDADSSYKNEGLVIGVGPGVADGAGGRLTPQVIVGDYVMFGERNVVQQIRSDSPPYQGQLVIIVSEKNIICKLPNNIEWDEYEGD